MGDEWGNGLGFDYYYGVEAEQFSFYRVPKMLIKDKRFKKLSSDAKLLYGLMLDRMALSMKNGWLDSENRVYIHYTMETIMEDLQCAKATCAKVLAELDSKKGIGLIEKKRQGLGRPDIIYVKNFVTEVPSAVREDVVKKLSDADNSTEVQNLNFKKFKNNTSRGSESEFQEVQKLNANDNNINNTDRSNHNPINQSDPMVEKTGVKEEQGNGDDRSTNSAASAYIEIIKKNIEYEHHMKYDQITDRELYEELFGIICEIVCVERRTVKIGGEDYPYELVRSKFLKLNSSHLQYVMDCMRNTRTKITNIKAYMVTALYNAPNTMNHYYKQKVQHDWP